MDSSWEVGEHELIRIYSKEFHSTADSKGGIRRSKIRVESQEYPQWSMQSKTYSTAITVVVTDGDDDYLIPRTSLIAFFGQVHTLNAKKFLLKLHRNDSVIGEELLEGGGP